jgi:hypothetical protein
MARVSQRRELWLDQSCQMKRNPGCLSLWEWITTWTLRAQCLLFTWPLSLGELEHSLLSINRCCSPHSWRGAVNSSWLTAMETTSRVDTRTDLSVLICSPPSQAELWALHLLHFCCRVTLGLLTEGFISVQHCVYVYYHSFWELNCLQLLPQKKSKSKQ